MRIKQGQTYRILVETSAGWSCHDIKLDAKLIRQALRWEAYKRTYKALGCVRCISVKFNDETKV